MDLETVASDLYALTPEEFTSARSARVKEAKAAGDSDLAKAVGALTKPTIAAWVVNLLVRHSPEQIDQVLTLGVSLRSAQESLDATQMRDLTRQRRRLTTAVTSQGRAVARQLGHPVSDATATQVEATLHAAMVDEGAAQAVRAGQLTQPLSASGFGSVDISSVRPATPHRQSQKASRPSLEVVHDDTRERDAAQVAIREATHLLTNAEHRADEARQAAATADARSLELEEQLDELRRQVTSHERELDCAEDDRAEAAEQRELADEAVAQARRGVHDAQGELDRLKPAPARG